MKVGLISDTHAYLDPKLPSILADCDEIWHAGDVGNLILEDHFDQPVRAVYGNIDSAEIRHRYPQDLWLRHENQSILMTHIAGRPNRYPARVKALLRQEPVIALICGHSHIPLVQRHPELPLLHINPGALEIASH
jgi:putative phosphoesterase